MSDVSISEMTYTMLSLLFLLLGIVLIVSIIMSKANPYDSIAFANVEKLSAAMNQVCAGSSEVSIKFDLPQNTPALNTLFAVLPLWIIRTNGDPNYVLYYESYPPGDAIGWEVYQSMQNRLVTSLPEGFEDKTQSDVDAYVNSVRDLWNTQVTQNDAISLPSKNLEGIVVNNIVIGGPRSDYYLGEGTKTPTSTTTTVGIGPENALAGAFRYGDWKSVDDNMQPRDGDNAFIFNSYTTLNSFEKSAIKYEACGDNSLCFKTRSGVYRYSLDQCSNIKNIQMVYDARNRAKLYAGAGIVVGAAIGCIFTGGACAAVAGGVGSAGGWAARLIRFIPFGKTVTVVAGGTAVTVGAYEAASWLYGAFLSYKVQDFNLASPCSIKEMTIKKADCTDAVLIEWAADQKACTDVIRTPLYQYGIDGKLHPAGDHYTCMEKVGSGLSSTPSGTFDSNDQCLQILVTEKADDFCWTPDPFRPTFLSDTQIFSLLIEINQRVSVNNILENTAYISSPTASAYVLKYYPTGDLESWKDFVARQISWAWPG